MGGQNIGDIGDILSYLFLLHCRHHFSTVGDTFGFFPLYDRLYTTFLDFSYPELDASSKKTYSNVEGWDHNLKIFIPFFATINTDVYNKLVEVLKKDSKRFLTIFFSHVLVLN